MFFYNVHNHRYLYFSQQNMVMKKMKKINIEDGANISITSILTHPNYTPRQSQTTSLIRDHLIVNKDISSKYPSHSQSQNNTSSHQINNPGL